MGGAAGLGRAAWSPDISVGPGWWRGAGGRTSRAPPGCHHLQAPGHWTPTPPHFLSPDTRHVPSVCLVCAWCVPGALGATCPRHCPLAGLVAYGDHRRQFTSRMEPVVKRTIYDQQPPTAARGTALSLQLKYKTMLKPKHAKPMNEIALRFSPARSNFEVKL